MCKDPDCKIVFKPNPGQYSHYELTVSRCTDPYLNYRDIQSVINIVFQDCPNITLSPYQHLPNVRGLTIVNCPRFDIDSLIDVTPHVCNINITDTDAEFQISRFWNLRSIMLSDCPNLRSITDNRELYHIEISNCPRLDTVLCNRNLCTTILTKVRDREMTLQERLIRVHRNHHRTFWMAGIIVRRLRCKAIRARRRIIHRNLLTHTPLPDVLCPIIVRYAL